MVESWLRDRRKKEQEGEVKKAKENEWVQRLNYCVRNNKVGEFVSFNSHQLSTLSTSSSMYGEYNVLCVAVFDFYSLRETTFTHDCELSTVVYSDPSGDNTAASDIEADDAPQEESSPTEYKCTLESFNKIYDALPEQTREAMLKKVVVKLPEKGEKVKVTTLIIILTYEPEIGLKLINQLKIKKGGDNVIKEALSPKGNVINCLHNLVFCRRLHWSCIADILKVLDKDFAKYLAQDPAFECTVLESSFYRIRKFPQEFEDAKPAIYALFDLLGLQAVLSSNTYIPGTTISNLQIRFIEEYTKDRLVKRFIADEILPEQEMACLREHLFSVLPTIKASLCWYKPDRLSLLLPQGRLDRLGVFFFSVLKRTATDELRAQITAFEDWKREQPPVDSHGASGQHEQQRIVKFVLEKQQKSLPIVFESMGPITARQAMNGNSKITQAQKDLFQQALKGYAISQLTSKLDSAEQMTAQELQCLREFLSPQVLNDLESSPILAQPKNITMLLINLKLLIHHNESGYRLSQSRDREVAAQEDPIDAKIKAQIMKLEERLIDESEAIMVSFRQPN